LLFDSFHGFFRSAIYLKDPVSFFFVIKSMVEHV
jgi:hypothetical protein